MHYAWLHPLVLAAVVATGSPVATSQEIPLTEESVARTLSAGVEFIYSVANKDGVWDDGASPTVAALTAHLGNPAGPYETKVFAWGGRTALALNALALSGQQRDPRFVKATQWLMKQELESTYALGLRMQLIHLLGGEADYLPVLRKDYKKLLAGARAEQTWAIWQYAAPPVKYLGFVGDYSNTNYAVLGFWAASNEREEVSREIWQKVERAWVVGQDRSGGWAYLPGPAINPYTPPEWKSVRGSMTAAAIASLYLVVDNLADRNNLGSFHSTPAYKSLTKGIEWLGENFDARKNPGGSYVSYYFYNVERAAAAGGMKFIGKHDWFREIAATILAARKDDGQIALEGAGDADGAFVDTCFAMMFLSTGSAPVIMSKLQHDGDWDNRLRDVAILTNWLARQSERPTNWQVVNLDVAPEDLTDSRILYIAGVRALKFSPEKAAKLKRYVELGGLLVFQGDVESKSFNDSAANLLERLWPGLKLAPVDLATHPLGNIQYPLKGLQVEQFASPTRVFAFVLHGMPAFSWEDRRYQSGLRSFQLGANLHYFATDRAPLKSLPTRLTCFAEPFRRPSPPVTKTITLARIKHGTSPLAWDPEPLAFERLGRLLAVRDGLGLEIKALEPVELAASGARVAHLTGSDEVKFTPQQSEAIANWIKGGGLLIIDQAGGGKANAGAFDRSIRPCIKDWCGGGELSPLSSESDLARQLGLVVYRNFNASHVQKIPPRLEGVEHDGRLQVIYSPLDLTTGMLNVPNPMVAGMDADSVYRLFKAILVPPTPATTQAATSQLP